MPKDAIVIRERENISKKFLIRKIGWFKNYLKISLFFKRFADKLIVNTINVRFLLRNSSFLWRRSSRRSMKRSVNRRRVSIEIGVLRQLEQFEGGVATESQSKFCGDLAQQRSEAGIWEIGRRNLFIAFNLDCSYLTISFLRSNSKK